MEAELERFVTHDALTGLKNRGSLLEILGRELRRTRRTRVPTGVVLVDIDRLGNVNDAHGHAVGDEVLVEVAKRCFGVVRDYDAFGRFGGEEFLLVSPGANSANMTAVAARLLDAIARSPVKTAAGELRITASAGAASTDLGRTDLEALLTAVAEALHRAKSDGRACVRIAEPAASTESDFPPEEPDTMKAPE
jgi:diguanylate cyclase (GGDEF)-like protein